MAQHQFITTEIRDNIFLIGFNRPDKRNAMNTQMLREFALSLTEYEDNDDLRCAVIFAHGKAFSLGLELDDVSETIKGNALLP